MIEVELSTISCLVPAVKKSLFSSLGDKSSILVLFGFNCGGFRIRSKYDINTIRVDAYVFQLRRKNLRFQKYPAMCRLSLRQIREN